MARSWFADGILHVLRLRNEHPDDVVVLALPDKQLYRRLVESVHIPLEDVRISVLWVTEYGDVSASGSVWDEHGTP
jgi:hypothetical protein